MGTGFFFSYQKYYKIDSADSCATMNILKTIELYFKLVNYVICKSQPIKLYENKKEW